MTELLLVSAFSLAPGENQGYDVIVGENNMRLGEMLC